MPTATGFFYKLVGGTYGGFAANTAQIAAHGPCGAVFEAPIVGVPGPPAATKSLILSNANGICGATAIATQKTGGGTLLSTSAAVSLPADMSPAVNPLTGDVVYNAKLTGFGAGLFLSSGGSAGPLITFLASNPQVDVNGNMVARLP